MAVRGRWKNPSWGLLSGITTLAKWCQTVIPRYGVFYLSLTPMIDSFSSFTSESGFLIMQSLRLQTPPYCDNNTVTFSDVITFSDANLNDSVPWRPIQPYKNLSWVWGIDRKIRPEGQTVIPRDRFFYRPLRSMIDSFSCIPFTFHFWQWDFDNAVTSIADVRHIVMTILWH